MLSTEIPPTHEVDLLSLAQPSLSSDLVSSTPIELYAQDQLASDMTFQTLNDMVTYQSVF